MTAQVKIGFDTEAFLRNSRGEIVPMGGLIPGTKEKPHNIHGEFFIQEDGVAIETNTPVSDNPERAHQLLGETWEIARKWLRAFLPSKAGQEMRGAVGRKLFEPSTVDIEYATEYTFDPEKLKLAGPGAFVFGCDPDFNAYEYDHNVKDPSKRDSQNSPIDIDSIGGLRFAGGHVHFGYDKTIIPPHVVVQFLDMIQIAVGSLDRGSHRAQYYGKPGCYRIKPYGVEYRTPSTGMLLSGHGRTFLQYAHVLLRNASPTHKKNLLYLYKKYYNDILRIPNGDYDVKNIKTFLPDLLAF